MSTVITTLKDEISGDYLAPRTKTSAVTDDNNVSLDTTLSNINTSVSGKINSSEKGVASGVATLDSNAKVPMSQINDALLGNVKYQGLWNASTNTPTLPNPPTNKGHYYITSVAGTQFGISFEVGDWIVAGDTSWQKVDNTDAVSSVAGRTGNVILTKTDVGLGNVDNTSDSTKKANFTGSIASGNTGFVTGNDVYNALPTDYTTSEIDTIWAEVFS